MKKSSHIIEEMHMEYAPSIKKALELAYKYTSNESKITIIPDGVSVIIK